jgi:uncharacterized protein
MKKEELMKMKKEQILSLAKKQKIIVDIKSTKEELVQVMLAAEERNKNKKAEKKKAVKPVKEKKETVKKSPKEKIKVSKKEPSSVEMNDIIKGESKKFEIEDNRAYYEPAYKENGEESFELPDSYNETKLILLVQNPYWIHAYWEFSAGDRKKFGLEKGRKDISIRVYHADTDDFFDVHVNDSSKSWYFNVPFPNRPYFSEIGILDKGGKFIPIARSNVIMVPTDKAMSSDADPVSKEIADELFKKSGGHMIHRLAGSQIVSEWAAMPNNSFSGSISSGSGGMGVSQPGKRNSFWTDYQTELIVYGSTEPNSTVSVGDIPLSVSQDGKFSIRFSIKDGEHKVTYRALSDDKRDVIEITSHVTIRTERKEFPNR